jgi:hypothetical protein
MSHEITTPSGNLLFGLWLSDQDWQDDSFPDLEPLIVGIQREASAATVARIRVALPEGAIGEDPEVTIWKPDVLAILDAEERGWRHEP